MWPHSSLSSDPMATTTSNDSASAAPPLAGAPAAGAPAASAPPAAAPPTPPVVPAAAQLTAAQQGSLANEALAAVAEM